MCSVRFASLIFFFEFPPLLSTEPAIDFSDFVDERLDNFFPANRLASSSDSCVFSPGMEKLYARM